ncbi:2-C-methyl-D-erythritol 4-phosphate cytidylyltransferase [Chloroflexota bacterium]
MMKGGQKVGAVIVAAGGSQRMGGIDKLLVQLGGEPLLLHATRPFQESSLVSQVVVVVGSENKERCQYLVAGGEWSKVSDVCLGGERRQDSVAVGLERLERCDWVIIHDGARPLVTVDLIERGLMVAQETGAAVAAVPVTDTIKVAGDDKIVSRTLSRKELWAVQTPQVFRADIMTEAYLKAEGSVTDDASLVEKLGYRVKLYMSSYDNIKVTTHHDLALAELIQSRREELHQ